ncbi:hypothetical protein U1Q18_025661 [Sarracenia purpurea var. burkii]
MVDQRLESIQKILALHQEKGTFIASTQQEDKGQVCLALAAMSEGPQLVLGMPIWFAILLDFIKGATDSELSLILEACLYADVLGFSNGAAYFLVKVLLLSELLSHLPFGSSSLGLWFYAMVFLHLVQCC